MRWWLLAVTPVALTCACLTTPPEPGPGPGGAADAGPPDAATWEDECDSRFDSELEYRLCLADSISCHFYTEREGTCSEICATHDGICTSSFNTSGGSASCEPSSDDEGCDDPHDGQICVCTR